MYSLVPLALLLCLAGANGHVHWGLQDGLNKESLKEILAQVAGQKTEGLGRNCECVKKKYDCGCCVYVDIPEIGLKDTVCVNVTYLVHDIGVALTLSVDGKVYLNTTVSARNPPPLCLGIPGLKKLASICLDLYNLDISKTAFSGCVKLQARLVHVKVESVELGCFRIPLSDKDQWAMARDPGALQRAQQSLNDLTLMQEKKRKMLMLL